MRALAEGVELTKAEIACLLAFTGEDDIDVVVLTVSTRGMPTIEAYSTDGVAAVSGESGEVFDDAAEGQWSVNANFLREVKKVIPKACILKLEGQCLTEAVLLQESDGELIPCGSYVSERNQIASQLGMGFGDELRKHCKDRSTKGDVAPCVRLQANHLAAMKSLAAAVEDHAVEVMLGATGEDVARFVARNGETAWIAVVTPLARAEEFRTGSDPRQVVASFVDSMADSGVTSMSVNGVEVDLTKRTRKPSKKTKEVASA